MPAKSKDCLYCDNTGYINVATSAEGYQFYECCLHCDIFSNMPEPDLDNSIEIDIFEKDSSQMVAKKTQLAIDCYREQNNASKIESTTKAICNSRT